MLGSRSRFIFLAINIAAFVMLSVSSSFSQQILSRTNIDSYMDQLIAPLSEIISQENLQINIIPEDSLAAISAKNRCDVAGDADINLQDKESLHSGAFCESDPSKKANLVLSYINKFVVDGNFFSSFTFSWYGTRELKREAGGHELRLGGTSQKRFIVKFVKPDFISGYQLDSEPQASSISLFSPLMRSRRVLDQISRFDPLFGSIATYDDLSGYLDVDRFFSAKIIDSKLILVPEVTKGGIFTVDTANTFMTKCGAALRDDASLGVPEGKVELPNCKSSLDYKVLERSGNFNGSGSYSEWQQFFSGNYNLSNVLIIELLPTDPLYPAGKSILFVDKEKLLPYYRIFYTRSGEFLKLVTYKWDILPAEKDQISKKLSSYYLNSISVKLSFSSQVIIYKTNKVFKFDNANSESFLNALKSFDLPTQDK